MLRLLAESLAGLLIKNTFIGFLHRISLPGLVQSFLRIGSWVPRVSIPKEAKSTCNVFLFSLGSHVVPLLPYSTIWGSQKVYSNSRREGTDFTTQWEEFIKVNLRRTCTIGDSVATICHNVLQWKDGILFQSWLLIGEGRKMRWRGHEEYSMSQRRKGRVRAQSKEENLCRHLLSCLTSFFPCKAAPRTTLWFFLPYFLH